MRNNLKKSIAVLLSLVIAFAFTLSGCGDKSENPAKTDVTKGVAGVEYYHYDKSDFDDQCDELEELASGNDADALIKTYDALYDECLEMESLYAVIYVMYSTDVANEYYSDEQLYTYDVMQKSSDRLCEVCRKVTEGPCADQFREHVGKDAFDYFAEYTAMTEREKKLMTREKKLVDKYYDVIDKSEKATYNYDGTDWTFDMISGNEGDDLSLTDYDGYLEIYDGLLKQTNDEAGPIFLELVQIRNEIANLNGYDNYAAYADEEEYTRDYSEDEIDQLHNDVKKIANEFFNIYYTSNFLDEASTPLAGATVNRLLENLQKYSALVDEIADDSAQKLVEEKLYSIGDEKGRQDGAFTTFIYNTDCPFISMKLDNQRDFIVLTHEFGHFIEYNNEEQDNVLTDSDNIDLAEIASNGYAGLMTHFYKDIYKGKADAARKATVGELLENVIDGCIEDEFQRAIYENPDMSLDEINQLYADTYSDYNRWMEGDPGYSWVFISHTFEAPMYYISYTVSALAALQIWNQSNKNFEGAVKTWKKFIREGTFNKTYLDVVEKCGLQKFTEKGAVKKICKPALKAISMN